MTRGKMITDYTQEVTTDLGKGWSFRYLPYAPGGPVYGIQLRGIDCELPPDRQDGKKLLSRIMEALGDELWLCIVDPHYAAKGL